MGLRLPGYPQPPHAIPFPCHLLVSFQLAQAPNSAAQRGLWKHDPTDAAGVGVPLRSTCERCGRRDWVFLELVYIQGYPTFQHYCKVFYQW